MRLAAAAADCESRDDWFLAQDVNAWTSLAYVVAGLAVGVGVVRRQLPRSFAALATMTVLAGVGSWLYHGTSGEVAQLLHDVCLLGVVAYVAGWHVGRLAGAPDLGALVGLSTGVVAGAVAWTLTSAATNVALVALVVATLGAEIAAREHGAPAVWTAPLVLGGAIAAATWIAGATSSPLCDERSWVQLHGAWHVLTALLLVAWSWRAAEVR
jgi:hypothetical protein